MAKNRFPLLASRLKWKNCNVIEKKNVADIYMIHAKQV